LIDVDTLLLLPVYVPEVNSELANSVVKGAEDLLVSDLTVAEFLVGLARKVKLGTLSQELAWPPRFRRRSSGTWPKDTSGESRWLARTAKPPGSSRPRPL
jgi:hypothetical protein